MRRFVVIFAALAAFAASVWIISISKYLIAIGVGLYVGFRVFAATKTWGATDKAPAPDESAEKA